MCCPYCGEYIFNAGFQMRIHQATCPNAPKINYPAVSSGVSIQDTINPNVVSDSDLERTIQDAKNILYGGTDG